MKTIDLNADIGEGGPYDAQLVRLASSVNIACGGHAGSVETMRRTIALAMKTGAAIGAHPGYEDPENFGRTPMHPTPAAVRDLVMRQVARLLKMTQEFGCQLHHVKAHGALYHEVGSCRDLANAFASVMLEATPKAKLYAAPSLAWAEACRSHELELVAEGFADRRYQTDGSLMPRAQDDAVIHSPEEAARQALALAECGEAESESDPTSLPYPRGIRTLCIHGDNPAAVSCLAAARRMLESRGWAIAPPPAIR